MKNTKQVYILIVISSVCGLLIGKVNAATTVINAVDGRIYGSAGFIGTSSPEVYGTNPNDQLYVGSYRFVATETGNAVVSAPHAFYIDDGDMSGGVQMTLIVGGYPAGYAEMLAAIASGVDIGVDDNTAPQFGDHTTSNVFAVTSGQEYVIAYSAIDSADLGGINTATMEITTVPEPSGMVLICLGAGAALFRRNRS